MVNEQNQHNSKRYVSTRNFCFFYNQLEGDHLLYWSRSRRNPEQTPSLKVTYLNRYWSFFHGAKQNDCPFYKKVLFLYKNPITFYFKKSIGCPEKIYAETITLILCFIHAEKPQNPGCAKLDTWNWQILTWPHAAPTILFQWHLVEKRRHF